LGGAQTKKINKGCDEKMKNKTIKIFGIGAAVLFLCLTLIPMTETACAYTTKIEKILQFSKMVIIYHPTGIIVEYYLKDPRDGSWELIESDYYIEGELYRIRWG
jgi:hypothetical protein